VDRVIGTLRRECPDHVKAFLVYYHESRTHLPLAKDTPEPRLVHPPEPGAVVALPQVGSLHHGYERRAA